DRGPPPPGQDRPTTPARDRRAAALAGLRPSSFPLPPALADFGSRYGNYGHPRPSAHDNGQAMRSNVRWPLPVIVVLELAQCVWWIIAGSVMWSLRGLVYEPSSPQIAYNTRFAAALFALGGINVLAFIGFLVRPAGWGALVLAA